MDRRDYRPAINEAIRKQKIDNLTNRIRTSFIFAIARAEEEFGDLWAHNSKREKNDDEIVYYHKFQSFRKSVLDNGNNQIRLLESELGRIIK